MQITVNPEKDSEKEEISAKNGIENHRVLFERYEERLKNLDPELLTPEDEIVLQEAFTHAKEFLGPEEVIKWF
ncbi:kinesin, partial [Clostridium sp. Cult2]